MGNGTDLGTGIGWKWERHNMKTIILNGKREKTRVCRQWDKKTMGKERNILRGLNQMGQDDARIIRHKKKK